MQPCYWQLIGGEHSLLGVCDMLSLLLQVAAYGNLPLNQCKQKVALFCVYFCAAFVTLLTCSSNLRRVSVLSILMKHPSSQRNVRACLHRRQLSAPLKPRNGLRRPATGQCRPARLRLSRLLRSLHAQRRMPT